MVESSATKPFLFFTDRETPKCASTPTPCWYASDFIYLPLVVLYINDSGANGISIGRYHGTTIIIGTAVACVEMQDPTSDKNINILVGCTT